MTESEKPNGEAQPDDAAATEPELSDDELKHVMESLLLAAERPLTAVQIGRIVKRKIADLKPLLKEMMAEYEGRGIEIVEVGGGYQYRTAPTSARWVRALVAQRPVRLTRAQLEALALVAYRQPITRPEIEEVRGVDSGSALHVLLERSLLRILGRKEEPGRPLLYGTTPEFLEFFGLTSLNDLPTLREFTDLSEESRMLFQRKAGQSVEEAEAEQAEAATSEGDGEAEVEADAMSDAPMQDPTLDDDEDLVDLDEAMADAVAVGRRLQEDEEPEPRAEAG